MSNPRYLKPDHELLDIVLDALADDVEAEAPARSCVHMASELEQSVAMIQRARATLVLLGRVQQETVRRTLTRYCIDGKWTAWTKPTKTTVPTTKRACMCCREMFDSEGNHNRLCAKCSDLSHQIHRFTEEVFA